MAPDDSTDLEALIFRAAGFRLFRNDEDRTTEVFAALTQIGVPESRLVEFAERLAIVGYEAQPRDPVGSVSAEEIERAMRALEDGLKKLGTGMAVLGFAGASTSPGSANRRETLHKIQSEVLDVLSKAMAGALRIDPELTQPPPVEASDCDASLLFGRRGWAFLDASERLEQMQSRTPRSSFHAQRRDYSPWEERLIIGLAGVYEDATGKRATVANPNERAREGYRSQFPRFVAELWRYFDLMGGDPPGDDSIKGFLRRRATA